MIAFPVSKKKLLSKNGKKTAAGCGSLFPLCKMNNENAWASPPRFVCGCFYFESVFYHQDQLVWKRHGMGLCKGHGFYKTLQSLSRNPKKILTIP